MKCNVAFHLLHGLVNVAIEHGDRPETFEIPKRLLAVVRPPTPLGIHGPKRDVREDHDGRTAFQSLHIFFQPLELLRAEGAESTRLEVYYIDQADEVDSIFVETVPAATLRCLALAVQVVLAVVGQDIVLARDEKHIFRARALQHLVHRIEFSGFGKVADVPRVQ